MHGENSCHEWGIADRKSFHVLRLNDNTRRLNLVALFGDFHDDRSACCADGVRELKDGFCACGSGGLLGVLHLLSQSDDGRIHGVQLFLRGYRGFSYGLQLQLFRQQALLLFVQTLSKQNLL